LPLNGAVPGNIHTHPIWKVIGYSEESVKVMGKLPSRGEGVGGKGGGGWRNFNPKKNAIVGEWDKTRKKLVQWQKRLTFKEGHRR